MRFIPSKTSKCAAMLIALLWAGASQAAVVKMAGDRAGFWEAAFFLNYLGGEDLDLDGTLDSDIDNNMGWGLGFHYNLNSHWNLGFDMAFNNPDYSVDFIDRSDGDNAGNVVNIDHDASRFDAQFNVQYNILTGPITPFVQAGIGWTYIDSNVVESLDLYCNGYYYYPYCRTYANTYDDTSFSYNLGVGLRWDVTNQIYLKAAYIQQWVDSDGAPEPQTGRLEVGYKY